MATQRRETKSSAAAAPALPLQSPWNQEGCLLKGKSKWKATKWPLLKLQRPRIFAPGGPWILAVPESRLRSYALCAWFPCSKQGAHVTSLLLRAMRLLWGIILRPRHCQYVSFLEVTSHHMPPSQRPYHCNLLTYVIAVP